MNKDFSKYKKIIDDFSGKVLNKDFEAKFSSAVQNIPKTESFLLKMELKRLAAPCSRLIDLRGQVDGECKPFEHEGKLHLLDDVAEKVFKIALKRYKSYTFGVYEEVMNTDNNFRVIYKKEINSGSNKTTANGPRVFEKTQYPAKFYSFGPYHARSEERMNLAVAVKVSFEDKSTLECTSSDLSITGCKLKVDSAKPINVGQKIILHFSGLDTEYKCEDDLIYEIKNISATGDIKFLGVKRLVQQESHQDSFMQFVADFIQNNKRRYKINIDNTIEALSSRGFEQHVLPKSNELPVFMEKKNSALIPKYALTCHNNQSTYQYWQDEKHFSTLHCLMNADRIAKLKKLRKSEKTLLVFSFIHINKGNFYFYTADELQLAEDNTFKQQFLAFAASKTSFAITQLSLIDVIPSRAQSLLALPNKILEENGISNDFFDEKVQLKIASMPFVVVASDITHPDAIATYKLLSYENIDSNRLKSFGHKRLINPYVVEEVGITYQNHRAEQRFKYQTPVHLALGDVIQQGLVYDFSPSGLKVKLDEDVLLDKGDIVNISFPQLQKITSSYDLKVLPYEVVQVNFTKALVNLRVSVDKHQHNGRKFFKALIERNRDKLTLDKYDKSSPELAIALRNIYSLSSKNLSLVIQTSGSRYKVEVVASGQKESKLMTAMRKLSDHADNVNLYPLIGRSDVFTNLATRLKKMQRTDTAKTEILYIAIEYGVERTDTLVTTKMASELRTEEDKYLFISKALKQGDFYCIMVTLSRASEPNMEYLNPELSYIALNAIHRGKQIEQEIWSVAGVAQMFDITKEALFRYQFAH